MDHRAHIVLQESDRLERKPGECLEQTFARSTPAERVRFWERQHGLKRSRNENDPLVGIAAHQTDLVLDQVCETQLQREAGISGDAAVVPIVHLNGIG